MSGLFNYLRGLDSIESLRGVWVNPENPLEEFRTGQYCFDNGGMDDGWIDIGTLAKLSFGSQSQYAAFEAVAPEVMDGHGYNTEALYDLWASNQLHSNLQEQFNVAIAEVTETWASEEADTFLRDELPELLNC